MPSAAPIGPDGPSIEEARGETTARLLAWYDLAARELPWRIGPAERRAGIRPEPYRVWLSEIMLQQTRVAAVIAYFERFVARWPDVGSLAAAEDGEVMSAWAGLGYYSRARNLKRCSEIVAGKYHGRFPQTAAELAELPGIGAYTAAAIAAIAFDAPEAAVDGNVERVISRRYAIGERLSHARAEIRSRAAALVDAARPGDFAQALMDLGATVCTPRSPDCPRCPWRSECVAALSGEAERYPVRESKPPKPVRRGAAFVAVDPSGAILLEQRPPSGLLGGMAGLPTTGWSARRDGLTGAGAAPFAARWQLCGTVRHVFTHFCLELEVWRCQTARRAAGAGWWAAPHELDAEALPNLMRKAIRLALAERMQAA